MDRHKMGYAQTHMSLTGHGCVSIKFTGAGALLGSSLPSNAAGGCPELVSQMLHGD